MTEGWELIWEDTFERDGRPDEKKWTLETGTHWFNGEKQAYTDRPANACVRDGLLHLTARKERVEDREFTSARIMTWPHAAWQYGRFEVRACIPKAAGSWPAIWLLPASYQRGVRWPLCGEIDVMEHSMLRPDEIVFSLHSEKLNHTRPGDAQRSTWIKCPGTAGSFRVYGLEWTKEYVDYYLDGERLCRYTRPDDADEQDWPFDQPFYLIMNVAVGGFMGGPIDEQALPCDMLVDYVRVYRRTESPK
ncbi:MAG: glycoside hydrolase family 16 protein [Clostridia bacterium]|nr:glycoside hydrolase family 16 protein [Clostridia bacterium]